jgi:hypothetical protein
MEVSSWLQVPAFLSAVEGSPVELKGYMGMSLLVLIWSCVIKQICTLNVIHEQCNSVSIASRFRDERRDHPFLHIIGECILSLLLDLSSLLLMATGAFRLFTSVSKCHTHFHLVPETKKCFRCVFIGRPFVLDCTVIPIPSNGYSHGVRVSQSHRFAYVPENTASYLQDWY